MITNIPRGYAFRNGDLEDCIREYENKIQSLFEVAASTGSILNVHTIQVLYQNKFAPFYYEIIVFIKRDEAAEVRIAAMKMSKQMLADMGQSSCKHEYDDKLTCIHCGHVM